MYATPVRPDAAPAALAAFNDSLSAAAAQTAVSAAQDSPATSMLPQSLLTPAVTRVIAWHQQRLSARHERVSAVSQRRA